MFAVIANHGTHDNVDYVTVAIQDKPMTLGGVVKCSNAFSVKEYASVDDTLEAALAWAQANGAEKTIIVEGLFRPELCFDASKIMVLDDGDAKTGRRRKRRQQDAGR